ncbi:MAG: alpha/beta hydrolase [Huintestinicola sp.]
MKISHLTLTPPYEKCGVKNEGLTPGLTCFEHDIYPDLPHDRRGAVIVCPGGGYNWCSKREGEPVAMRWYAYGFNTYLLDYSCTNKLFPTALTELAEAVSIVRSRADEANTHTQKIILCGFSAGAHLAASLGIHYGSDFLANGFDSDIRPDGMVLSYPVITTGEFAHRGSADSITGGNEKLLELTSLEKHVSYNTPPAFIWHNADDTTVPVENSLMFAGALSSKHISYELHIFPKGGHGVALCDDTTIKNNDSRYLNEVSAQWFELALDWVRRVFDIVYR